MCYATLKRSGGRVLGLMLTTGLILGSANLTKADILVTVTSTPVTGTMQDLTAGGEPVVIDQDGDLQIFDGLPASWFVGSAPPAFVNMIKLTPSFYLEHAGSIANTEVTGGWDSTGTAFSCSTSWLPGDLPGATLEGEVAGNEVTLTSYSISFSATGLVRIAQADDSWLSNWLTNDMVTAPSTFSATFHATFLDEDDHTWQIDGSFGMPTASNMACGTPAPEPATLSLLILGGLCATHRRRT